MNQPGFYVLIAALGMMAGLIAVDVANLMEWSQATKPAFVGGVLAHFSAVVGAFVGGTLMKRPANGGK